MINAVVLNQAEYDFLYYNMEGYKDQTRELKEEIKKLKNENESLKIKLNNAKHQVTSARIFYKNLMKQIDAKAEEQDFKKWAESLDFRYNHDLSLGCWSYNAESFDNKTEEEFIDDYDWYYNQLNKYALKNKPEPTHGWPENPSFYELYQMDNQFEKSYNMHKNSALLEIELFHTHKTEFFVYSELQAEMRFKGETYDIDTFGSPQNDENFTERTALAIIDACKFLPGKNLLKVCLTKTTYFTMLTRNYWYKYAMSCAQNKSIKVVFDNLFTFSDKGESCPF